MNIFQSRWFRTGQAIVLAVLGVYVVFLGTSTKTPPFIVAGVIIFVYAGTVAWFVVKAGRRRR